VDARLNVRFFFVPLVITVFIAASCSGEQGPEVAIASVKVSQATPLETSELFESLTYVPLETRSDAIIQEITKVLVGEDILVLFENFQLKRTFFVFDKKGRLLAKISDPGQGPGRFTAASDVLMDWKTGTLEILDKYQSKVIFYDISGTLQGDAFLPYNFEEFVKLDSDAYVFSAGNAIFDDTMPDELFWVSNFDRVDRSALPIPEEVRNMSFSQYAFASSKYDDSYLFRRFFDSHIYRVDSRGATPVLEVDFGDQWIDEEVVRKFAMSRPGEKLRLLNELEVVYNLKVAEEFDRFFLLAYFFDQRLFLTLVDKTTFHTLSYYQQYQSNRTNSIDGGVLPFFPIARHGKQLVFVHQAYELVEHAADHPQKIEGAFKEVIEGLKPEDNPVLIFAQLKEEQQLVETIHRKMNK